MHVDLLKQPKRICSTLVIKSSTYTANKYGDNTIAIKC